MAVCSIMIEAFGSAPPEGPIEGQRDMVDIGIESGQYVPCQGTYDGAIVMNTAGLPAKGKWPVALEDMAAEVDAGKGVIVGLEAFYIWYGLDESKWPVSGPSGHGVRVTGVDRAPDGSVRGFYINDSGDGSAPAYVPAATMRKALDAHGGGYMCSTIDPIQPPVT
jgi:hypothetical protein